MKTHYEARVNTASYFHVCFHFSSQLLILDKAARKRKAFRVNPTKEHEIGGFHHV